MPETSEWILLTFCTDKTSQSSNKNLILVCIGQIQFLLYSYIQMKFKQLSHKKNGAETIHMSQEMKPSLRDVKVLLKIFFDVTYILN
jgi:hypothetical protein